MAIFNLNPRRIMAGILSVGVFFMYAVPLPVLASEISGVTKSGNVYNIEAAKLHGSTGFRHYDKFNLDKGDIANLQFRKGSQEYTKFVNLVNNKININGIVNTMKGNNFYNGHAIFVSPQGLVVGASGVLNVGALSVLTPSQSKFNTFKSNYDANTLTDYVYGAGKYNELVTDSHGAIHIKGKIISRGDVELYGDTISVKGTSTDKAGIIAGANGSQVLTEEQAAKALFDELVANNIKETTNFALENGKVKIVAGFEDITKPELVKNATIDVDNAQIGGSEVKLVANTKTQKIVDLPTDTSSFTQDQINSLGFGVAEEATSKIEIKNSEFGAKDIKIDANSISKTKTNVNLLEPTVFELVLNDAAKASEYFSSGVFNGFDGGRANATVKVENTTINAKNDVAIGTNADVVFEINSKVLGQAVPAILYGLGIKTVSGIDVISSTICADGDVSLNALSSHDAKIDISNSSLIEMDATNALVMALLNYSNITDTHAIISGNSEIEAYGLDVVAVNLSKSEVELKQTATVGKNDLATGTSYGSGAAFSILFNRSKNEVQALIKDSKVTVNSDGADDGGVRVIAQSLNVVQNAIEATANDDNYKGTAPKTFDQSVKNKLKQFKNKYMKHTIKDLFKRGNMDVNMDQADDAKVQASGVFLWNVTNNTATAKIENSTINAKKLDVKSYTVDLLSNKAITQSVGEAYYGTGIALIINDETNNTTSNIDKNSVVTVDELNLDATTQLPMNAGSLKFGLKLPIAIFGVQDLSFGISMDGNPAGNWDFSGIYPWSTASSDKPAVSLEGFADQNISSTYEDLKPKLKFAGFFNNFAQGSGNGNTAALSASVVVNNVQNNTTASVTGGSNVTVQKGDAILNAVTSVMGYNAVGIVDYLVKKINYQIPGQQDWKYEPNVCGATAGVGGSVLVNNYTNNATAKIEGSTVDVQKGDLKVRSAAEQSYLSALATGGKSETFVLDGSVHVQNLHGTTSAEILNSTITNAKNITVEAGKAKIKPSSSKVELDEETSELKTKDERDAKDRIINIIATGALAQQAEEVNPDAPVPQGSTGKAIGADVNVSHSDRTVRAKIDGSTVTAKENITINSESKNQTINVAFAGAFAGGVSVREQQPNNQPMQNAGNWQEMLDNAQPDDDDEFGLRRLFGDDNPNQQGANNAQQHVNDINNQNNNVDNNGNVNPNAGGNNGNNPGNNNGNLADNQAGPNEAGNNFSLAAAGVVDLYWNSTTTESVLTNSTVTVGKQLNVKSKGDDLYIDIGGGVARAGNVGGGAAVNIYNKSTTVRSLIGDANHNVSITYTGNSDKQLNVTADDSLLSVGVAVGVGVSKNQGEADDGKKFSLGGSFNMNVLKDDTEAIVQKATVKNKEGVNGDIATNVKSKNDSIIVSVAGGAAYTGGTEQNKGAAAGIAVGWDILKDTVKAQIIDSTLDNAGNIIVEASMPAKAYSVGIAGAIMNGPESAYTFDGALITEWYSNTVSSLIKGSTITSSGDVYVHSDYDAKNMSLAGSLEFSNAQSGGGLGIGAVIYGEQNNISANTESSTIEKSKSVKLESKSKEDMKFLAANLGMQTNGSKSFRVNGIASIMDSTIEAKVFNNSTINSNGQVSILADYDNSNQGITVVGEKTKDGMAFGANLIGSYYDNTTLAELGAGSSITTKNENNTNDSVNRDVKISATSKEYINIIPVSIGIASGEGNAVGADIVVNILKNHTSAHDYGNITTAGKLIVKALDDTMIYERGGVLASAGGTLAIGSVVYYDWLDKNVTAEVKNNTVKAGDITVQATAENSFGGTKKEDGTWNVAEMSTNPSDYGANFAQGASFKNWNMAYSYAHGDTAGSSGAIIVRVLDDVVKANVEGVTNISKSLTVFANDYTIMNTIVGEFNPANIGVGGSALVVIGETDTRASVTNGTHTLTGDLSVGANTQKDSRMVLVGGSGGDKVGVNGSVYFNKLKDTIISSIIGSEITANKVSVNSVQKNDNFGVSVSVAGSGTFSLGGILFVNYFDDTTKALVGDNSKSRTKITSANDVEVKSDSDYEAREYLVSVGASGKIGVSGLGIANVVNSTIESGVYNSDVTSNSGKLYVDAYRWFNKDSAGKTAFFRGWFKNTDAYKKQGVDNDTKQRAGITASDLSGMAPIVGALNVSAGGTGAGSGTIIVNKARGSLTSKIDNSTVTTKTGATALAKQEFSNFDAVAAVAGSANASINGVGVINSLDETVTAEVSNSTATKGSIKTDAQSNMNLNQLVISGEGAGQGAAVGVVVDKNSIEDKVHSYITNTTANAGASALSAHNIMVNNILVAGGGVGQGLSANVVPIINKFNGETFSKIEGSTIKGGDITLRSFDNLDNLSSVVGVGVAGQGANLAGYAIRNELSNKSKSSIIGSTINTTGKVNITADSVISSTNALFSAGIAGQGATLLANVISNTITSEVEGYIKDSTITKSGDIKITANVDNAGNKYRYDEITNTTGNVSFAGQGAALATNVIYTKYTNTVKAYIENTGSSKTGNITLDSNSERRLDNTNIGIGGAAMGATIAVNAISTDIRTTTHSYIDAKSKTMNEVGKIKSYSRDDTDIKNIMGTVQVAGLGAAAGVALDMTWNNNITKSEILSATDGQINAEDAELKSNGILEYGKTNVGVALGAVGLAGDYVLIKSGKRSGTYSQNELDSGIKVVIDNVEQKEKYTPLPDPTVTETGAISRVNGNLKTSGDININAESKIKGRGENVSLSLTNVTTTIGLGGGSVGVKDVDLATNTFVGIMGGKTESTTGKVSVNAKNTSNVDITGVEVGVRGVGFSGGSDTYTNSSETVAEIKDATVKSAGNIDVVSDSTSKSKINATNVIVSGGDIVAIDSAENKDTNKSVALVTGNTNIDAGGKLTVHSTANTDLDSKKVTVKVQGVGFVNSSKNEVRTSTICKALIENVTGTIKTHGLDITTDYGVMSANAKSNVIAVTIGGFVNTQNSGAFMNADFKSGIDSITGLNLINTGATTIITAKDNGTNGFVSKGEIYNVTVGGVQFAAVSSANSENTANVTTVLNSADFVTDSLYMYSYLKSSAKAESTGTKVDLAIGVNSVEAKSTDKSNLNLSIAGNNTVKGVATIETSHSASSMADLSAFGLSLLASGVKVRIHTELTANTTGYLGGNFNVNEARLNMNTSRYSSVSKSSGNGAIIVAVNDPDITNKLTGTSALTIKNFKSETSKGINNWTINNKSDNSFEVISSDGAGGIVAVSSSAIHTTFETSTQTNIENSDINSEKKVAFNVENSATVNESASNSGGGLVAVTTNNIDNSYTSNAKLSIKDSKIKAKDVELQTLSDIHTKTDGYVDYTGGGGGFVAVNLFNIKNTLTQSSEISLENADIRASNDVIVKAGTKSKFKQRIESTGRGFVTVPKSKNTLNVTNNNNLTLDNKTKIVAGNELDISFDSNNTLEARAVADARNFAGEPVAYSWLYLTVNNTLDNSGSLEAGNLVDINYMNSSVNNLTQYVYTECRAAIAVTDEGGILSRKINNSLNVNSGADITSGKDIEIDYTQGTMNISSKVSWKTISYACFGIPISNSKSYSVDSPSNTYSLKDDGKIVAGQGNSRYMKINRDGKIDQTTLKGFYDDDYIISDGEIIPGEVVKQKILASIKVEIDNVSSSIETTAAAVDSDSNAINAINEKLTPIDEKLTEINGLIENGAVLTDSNTDESGHSAFNDIINNDVNTLIIKSSESDTNKISQETYDHIMVDYNDKLKEVDAENVKISEWNSQHGPSEQKDFIELPTMMQFLNTKDYGLTSEQKTTVSNGYNTISGNLKQTEKGGFATYKNLSGTTYVSASHPRVVEGVKTCDEIELIKTEKTGLLEQLQPYKNKYDTDTAALAILQANKIKLTNEYTVVEGTPASKYEKNTDIYSITFNDISLKDSHIIVSGAYNHQINGNGVFSVANSGLKVDNYSTRTLVFNRIDIGSSVSGGLSIGGKNHSEFANKNQAVSGIDAYNYIQNISGHKSFANLPTNGVHYENSDDGIVGITVNNYYDVNHPFASTFNIPNPTKASDLMFMGDINTNGDFNVWNESGSIFVGNNSFKYKDMSLISTNGNILLMLSGDKNTPCVIKSNDYIFACNGLTVWADRKITVDGTIKTGYSNRSITITEDMIKPENLIIDDTSGEKNMIDLGGDNISPYLNETNNMKAIYVDGQIYLYSCSVHGVASSNGVNFIPSDDISITGHITMADGYQNITIDNKTTSQLNVSDIINNQILGHVADSIYNAFQDKFTINKLDHATTTISSVGKLVLNGNIHNNLAYGSMPVPNGVLNITANNGLDINPRMKMIHNVETLVDSILAGGTSNITINGGLGNIKGRITTKGVNNITNNGNDALNISGDIYNDSLREISSTAELITLGNVNIINEGSGALNLSGLITQDEGIVSVQSNGQTEITNVITDKKGDVYIASKGLNFTENAKVVNNEGNVTVTNNPYAEDSSNVANMVLNGDINADNGSIIITNNGNSATLGYIKTTGDSNTVVGNISGEQGDIVIVNTKGDMTITSNISHDAANPSSNGMISITNTGDNLNINSSVTTTGAGKSVNNGIEDILTAILIDNQSENYGLNLHSTISARKGDIIIKNANKNMYVSGNISNTESGNINIANSGQTLQESAVITNVKGNTVITNNGTGATQIGGSITNNSGNTDISSAGVFFELSGGNINNSGGNVTLTNTNENAQLRMLKNINNKGGDITIVNNGNSSEIAGNIINDVLSVTVEDVTTTTSGSIIISNQKGNLRILDSDGEPTIIKNTSDDAEKGITITGAAAGNNLQIDANIESTNKGNITVTNSGSGNTNINGSVTANVGSINITNNNGSDANTTIVGNITTSEGNISIANNDSKNLTIKGNIENKVKGNISISQANSGELSILSDIKENDGEVSIYNANSKDINISPQASITSQKGDINVTNDGTSDIYQYGDIYAAEGNVDVTNPGGSIYSKGSIIANEGDISVKNLDGDLIIDTVYGTGKGNIDILNFHGNLIIDETAFILNLSTPEEDGTVYRVQIVNIDNDDVLGMYIDGLVYNTGGGNIDIMNHGREGAFIGGTVENTKGDIQIINYTKELTLNGEITAAESGNIKIINSGANGSVLTSDNKITAENGWVSISNSDGNFTMEDGAKISATSQTVYDPSDFDISILNYGSAGKATISGEIENTGVNGVSIVNNGASGIEFESTAKISNKKSDTIISNTKGDFTVKDGVEIINAESGNITISNSGDKAEISGLIKHAGAGDISISNSNDGALNMTGTVLNKKGNISVTNNSEYGADIGGYIYGEYGDISITNTNGDLKVITEEIGLNSNALGAGRVLITNETDAGAVEINTVISNDGIGGTDGKSIVINNKSTTDGMSVNSSLSARLGDIEIINSSDNLSTIGTISNYEQGGVSITNSGVDYTNTASISVKQGNVSINNIGSVNNENNPVGKIQFGGSILNQNGNTTISNSGQHTEITGTIDNTNGGVSITNTNGQVRVLADIANKGGNIIIANSGEYTEITSKIINETLSTPDTQTSGSINISNSNGNLRIVDDAEITNTSHNSNDAITIANAGNLLSVAGKVQSTNKGDIEITNTGSGTATISGQVSAKEGNVDISNSAVSDKLVISGSVADDKGNVSISNASANGAKISGSVLAKEGDITASNTNGEFFLTEEGTITDYKGSILINNTATYDGTSIQGEITANLGGITINNAGDILSISGSITDDKGHISMTNGGDFGTLVEGTILAKDGNITASNTDGEFVLTEGGTITDYKGNILINNTATYDGTFIVGAILDNEGDITLSNAGDSLNISGSVTDDNGNISISNRGVNGTEISGTVLDRAGNLDITNTNTANTSGIMITTTGFVSDANGVTNISNVGGKGITVEGHIKDVNANLNIINKDSNITIGEFNSDNDKYIDVESGNVVITQTNGNILNGVVDEINRTRSNYDLGDTEKLAYKTMISVNGDNGNLTMDVIDGDIGISGSANPGFSVDAATRDYTESINVNVSGQVIAKAKNTLSTDKRLINLRAKESDLNIKSVDSDGNVIITAADWKQADIRPVPDSKTDDTGYYVGYSVLSTADAGESTIKGQNISVISSNNIGEDLKKVSYYQYMSDDNPNASVSFESENDLNISGKATSGYEARIYQLISKRGSIDFDIESDADIKEISSGKGIKLTQKAQNLTIRELGMPIVPEGDSVAFDDMLNPHDDLVYGPDPVDPGKSVVPNYVVIRVLDAMDTPERSESNLTIYSLSVKGNDGENTQYYADGSRLADVTLMADNIYASSYKAVNSKVDTKANPNGVKLKGRTYTNEDYDPTDTTVYEAQGINAYGEGKAISLDILGVDPEVVEALVPNPQREKYIVQKSKTNVPIPFRNKNDRTAFYNYDFKADNVYISVNDYAEENRGVVFDTIYAKNAYVNTHDTNLSVQDGYINNYAEFRNKTKLAVVDNDYRRIVDSDMQLYTQKTGSFSMGLSNSTVMQTVAPVVDFNPYHLVNGYSSENSFVNLTFKETAVRQHNKDVYKELQRKNDYTNKDVSLVYSTAGFGLLPDDEIYEISRTKATINANNLKVGQKTTVKLQLNDVDIDVEAKVKEIHGDKANVQFLNMPEEISNQIMYEYMKKVNSMKNSISSL